MLRKLIPSLTPHLTRTAHTHTQTQTQTHTPPVHGRVYGLPSTGSNLPGPGVVINLDGISQAYLDAAAAAGAIPTLSRLAGETGAHSLVAAPMPSLSLPGVVSLATGATPDFHGVIGSTHATPDPSHPGWAMVDAPPDRLTLSEGEDCVSVLDALDAAGARVGLVTAKHEHAALLGRALEGRPAVVESVEIPSRSGAEASFAALDRGADLLEANALDVLFVSTSDAVPHAAPPESNEALEFLNGVDCVLTRIMATKPAAVGITSGHAVNWKISYDDSPRVTFLRPYLDGTNAHVLLPIIDPYPSHHGGLGGMAHIFFPPEVVQDTDMLARIQANLRSASGTYSVLTRSSAASALCLPPQVIGDLVVLADMDTVLGDDPDTYPELESRIGLRSTGSTYETTVPMILTKPLDSIRFPSFGRGKCFTSDIFDFVLN